MGIPSFLVGAAAAFLTAFAWGDPKEIVPLRAAGFLIVVVFGTAGAAGLAAPPKKLNPAGLAAGGGTGVGAALVGAGLAPPPKMLNPLGFVGAGVGAGLGVETAFFGAGFAIETVFFGAGLGVAFGF